MLTYESSKVSISALPPRKFPRTKMLNLGVLRYYCGLSRSISNSAIPAAQRAAAGRQNPPLLGKKRGFIIYYPIFNETQRRVISPRAHPSRGHRGVEARVRRRKNAKPWRNAHKTGPSGATRQQGLTGGVGGSRLVHNTRVQPLVCTVSPANTLATPIPLRLTADAIMQDLHQTGCSRPAWSWGAAGLLPTPSL